MKVGLYYTLRNPPLREWFKPWPDYYAEVLEQFSEIDRLGFNSINFTEHHFDPDGYNPSMMVMLTAAAMRTRHVRLGQNILQLPYHHPVRIAEDLTTIDILSNGRVSLNVGQSGRTFDAEFRAFGVNPKYRPSLTEEGLDIIRRCWTEDVFSYQGKRWQLQDVRVYPKPLQQPHPPMYAVTNSEASVDRAARMGINAIIEGGGSRTSAGNGPRWQELQARWRAGLARYGRKPEDFKTNTMGTCFVTDDPQREWARHRNAMFYAITYRRHDGLQPYARASGTNMQRPEDMSDWQDTFCTPEDCIRRLRTAFGEAAPDELLLIADRPGIPLSDTLEYHRNFAEKVLPYLQDLPTRN